MPITATLSGRAVPTSSAVTLIQHSAANLNIHLHCLVPDDVYRRTDGEPVFVEVPAPTDEALLVKRVFSIYLEQCPNCGGELTIIAPTSLTLTTLAGASLNIAM